MKNKSRATRQEKSRARSSYTYIYGRQTEKKKTEGVHAKGAAHIPFRGFAAAAGGVAHIQFRDVAAAHRNANAASAL